MEVLKREIVVTENRKIELDIPESVPLGNVAIFFVYDSTDNKENEKRLLGLHRGKVGVSDDFDEVLPDNFWFQAQ